MTRPMSENARVVASLSLRGRRLTLWGAVEHWLRELAAHLPLDWAQMTEAQCRALASQEMDRRDSRLPAQCLCEEEYVIEVLWRLVSDDEDRKARAERHTAIDAQLSAVEARHTPEAHAQQMAQLAREREVLERLNAQQRQIRQDLAVMTGRMQEPSPLQAEP